jgi:hypothetical protein
VKPQNYDFLFRPFRLNKNHIITAKNKIPPKIANAKIINTISINYFGFWFTTQTINATNANNIKIIAKKI